MTRILYVTHKPQGDGIGGRQQLSRLNAELLASISGSGFELIELDGDARIGRLFGYINGVNRAGIRFVCDRLQETGTTRVFLDGSNLGKLAQGIKRQLPYIEVITFFHNCEARFFLGALRRTRTPRALAVMASNYLAERSAVRFSDKRICLNQRDSEQLHSLYGLGATHISPMAMPDRLPAGDLPTPVVPDKPYALFVGGAFYANQAGIEWYCREVAPMASMHTYVVGKGMEAMRGTLEHRDNITIIGEVNDLTPWYLGAHVVVAPIFDGSGMKTKVAEALMYGKRILGTPEAFSGYEDIAMQAGNICRDAAGFADGLQKELMRPYVAIDERLRAIFQAQYSVAAATARLRECLDDSF